MYCSKSVFIPHNAEIVGGNSAITKCYLSLEVGDSWHRTSGIDRLNKTCFYLANFPNIFEVDLFSNRIMSSGLL